jgi:ABC-type oligopeptide transport system substrate-binding subunit
VAASLEIRANPEYLRALEAGAFFVTVQGWVCASADASEVLSFLLQSRDVGTGRGIFNYSGYRNAELDRIARDNLGVLDPAERLALLQRGLRIAVEDGPYLPLYSDYRGYVVSDTVRWTPRLDGEFRLVDVQPAE